MMLPLYRLATDLTGPFIRLYLAQRRSKGKEDAARFDERLGKSSVPRPSGRLIWLHAASVGESQSMLPLITHLLTRYPDIHVLFTTGTVSSARLIAGQLPDRVIHQYVPVDRMAYVRRFLDHWKPDVALWAESEFWPNLISETQARGIPMVLVNGRISPRSFAGWQRARGLIKSLLQNFEMCLGQTQGDAERLKKLGANRFKCVGNLKFASPPLDADADELARLQSLLGDRPRWLAASTHAGEEEIAADVHRALGGRHPGLLTIIVPRHPDRGPEILSTLSGSDLSIGLRSRGDQPTPETEIYIADTLGELGLFFRLANIVFMGKSLVPLGGQNPLEPLRLECAVLHGPHMANFKLMAEEMAAAGAAVTVGSATELAEAVGRLLTDADARTALITKGREYVSAHNAVVDAVGKEIDRVIAIRCQKPNRESTSHAAA